MSAIRFVCSWALAILFYGCTPAVYVHLYNATGEVITLTRSGSKEVVAVPPNTAEDVSPMYLPGERLLIHTSTHVWTYFPRDLFVPSNLCEQHVGVIRGYARIDARGHIFVLAPPHDAEPAQNIPQPAGFPVLPERPNQAMQPTTGRRTPKFSMTPTSHPAATRAVASGG